MFSAYVSKHGYKDLDFVLSVVLYCEIHSADKRTKEPWTFVDIYLLPATENLEKWNWDKIH